VFFYYCVTSRPQTPFLGILSVLTTLRCFCTYLFRITLYPGGPLLFPTSVLIPPIPVSPQNPSYYLLISFFHTSTPPRHSYSMVDSSPSVQIFLFPLPSSRRKKPLVGFFYYTPSFLTRNLWNSRSLSLLPWSIHWAFTFFSVTIPLPFEKA